jgi:hypothetical protein
LIESTRPSFNDTLRISDIANTGISLRKSHANVKSRINAVARIDPKMTMLPIKINHVLMTSSIVHPAPYEV